MEKLKNYTKKENAKQIKKAISDLKKAKKSDLIDLWYYRSMFVWMLFYSGNIRHSVCMSWKEAGKDA